MQENASVHLEQANPTSADPKVQKRIRTKYNLIRELVSTEESFVADLEVLLDIYHANLLKQPYCDYVSERDASALFTNLPQILSLSRTFVAHLKERVPPYIIKCDLTPPTTKNSKKLEDIESNVGEVVLEYMPNMEMAYMVYCAQSQFQLSTFYRVSTQGSPMVDKWLIESGNMSKPRTQAWTLDALLIKPVQRLLKYPLLLASMVEATSENHPDYKLLKLALDKMQEAANRINGIEPENLYVQSSTNLEGLTLVDSESPTKSQPLDYNTSMSQLKNNPQCDDDLELLVIQFDRKQRHIKNLTKYLRAQIVQIQKHFDSNCSFAHAWSSWGLLSEDPEHAQRQTSRLKVYQRFAMFSLPFTTSSSAHVSTNNLYKLVEDQVIKPLHDMWINYYNVSNSMATREKCYPAYQKYVEWKTVNSTSAEEKAQLDPHTLANADMFLRIHVMLKTELPDLFGMTEEIIDGCLVRFLTIQRDWFRVAVDSTSNVFGLTLADIRPGKRETDPIITAFKAKQSSKVKRAIEEDLAICQPQCVTGNSRMSMQSTDFQRFMSSQHSSTSSFSSINGSFYQQSANSMDDIRYTTSRSARSKSPMADHRCISPSIADTNSGSPLFSAPSTMHQPPHSYQNLHQKEKLSALSTVRTSSPGPTSASLDPSISNLEPMQTNSSSNTTTSLTGSDGMPVRRRSSARMLSGWHRRGLKNNNNGSTIKDTVSRFKIKSSPTAS